MIAAAAWRASEKSRLAHALARGTFVVPVELLPPRGYELPSGDRGARGR